MAARFQETFKRRDTEGKSHSILGARKENGLSPAREINESGIIIWMDDYDTSTHEENV